MGKVYLIGAGPGDPELLTLKGRRILEQADVVIYDRLANPLLLRLAPPHAEFIYCGKLPYAHAMKQADINRKIARLGKSHPCVVRLKGGDPNIFGRVGEEIDYLQKHDIPYEVIPGITAASAASCYAGFSLTHRSSSAKVTMATGHLQQDGLTAMDWTSVVNGGTLCLYMAVENLPLICEQMSAQGVSPEMPIAVVNWGTLGRQKVITGELGSFLQTITSESIHNPSMIVVGEVVRQREQHYSWFEELPLYGHDILIVAGSNKLSWNELIDYTSQGADVWYLELGDMRDQRFDELSAQVLSERGFTHVKFMEEGLDDAYAEWITEHHLPEEYLTLKRLGEESHLQAEAL